MGRLLARELGVPFRDADDLHSAQARAKMAAGIPLTDADRAPWLERVREVLHESPDGRVVACSALKERYRQTLRRDSGDVLFVHLTAPAEVIRRRLEERRGHYMPAGLLESQLADLERPAAAVEVDVSAAPSVVVAEVVRRLGDGRLGEGRVGDRNGGLAGAS
ncbi:MAG: gluconokinase [Rhodothermales bacterium]|nr:gluconokinase [Rhodothermales bacterium]